MRSINTFVLYASLLVVAAGCYGGNALIGIGQGLLVLAMAGAFFIRPVPEGTPKLKWKTPSSAWLLCLLVVVSFFSIIANLESYEKPLRDAKKLRHLALPLLILFIPLIRQGIRLNLRKWGEGVWVVLLSVAILVTIADAINLATGFHPLLPNDNPNRYDRLGGVFGMVMTYGYSMQITLLVVLGVSWLLLTGVWKVRSTTFWLTLLSVIVLGLGLFFSGSRGAMLGVAVGGLVFLFLTRSRWLSFGAVFALVVAVAYLFATDSRFLQKKGNDDARLSQWKTALVTGMKNPILGIGYRQFEKQCLTLKKGYGFPYDATITRKVGEEKVVEEGWLHSNAHNNFLEAFASTGVFGMLALLGFFLSWLREVWQVRETRLLFGPAIVGFLVAGCFENSFTDGEITAVLMLCYVASQLIRQSDLSREIGVVTS